MNLWIRSVLNVLWNVDNIALIFPEQYADNGWFAIFAAPEAEKNYLIGVYKSEEAALQVMSGIEEFIRHNEPGSIFIMPREEEDETDENLPGV